MLIYLTLLTNRVGTQISMRIENQPLHTKLTDRKRFDSRPAKYFNITESPSLASVISLS